MQITQDQINQFLTLVRDVIEQCEPSVPASPLAALANFFDEFREDIALPESEAFYALFMAAAQIAEHWDYEHSHANKAWLYENNHYRYLKHKLVEYERTNPD